MLTATLALELLDMVAKREINCIVVKDLSRFGRNYIEVGNFLEQTFPFLGVRFIAVNDDYDSKDPFICGFKGCQHIETLTNEIVERLIDSIHVYDSNLVEIVFKFKEEQERLFELIEDI